MENITQTKAEAGQINHANIQDDTRFLDAQTLENLAAFLSRNSNNNQSKGDIEASFPNQNQHPLESEKAQKIYKEIPEKGDRASGSHDSNSKSSSQSISRSRSRSKEKSHQRWIYCCSKCKKSGNKGKNCVCVVPATQRRISLSKEGCAGCSCKGCSKEDVQLRHERKKHEDSLEKSDNEEMRNGCCKECMKAFSSKGKACICQVPSSVRRRKLPDGGCLFCGCDGCNPEDKQKSMERELKITRDNKNEVKYIKGNLGKRQGRNGNRKSRSRQSSYSRSYSRSPSRSRSNSRSRDSRESEENLDNFNNSYIGGFLRNMFNIYPPLMGFGIPQRTYSYIYGKPPH